ncbi:hypothetical protein HMPREF0658_0350 [Hoylesella marshii DSM 16973 = JCM 13450]|uniref:Uncharacterized protein n=1 Tax=Hoylesella marshii DSM 16973 = JCM 13450 TaxID=862515 RepID=E0NQ99_9BACT|nr:hypothetical protein HMPREF0658_0350 [Hoylesella marshii DSM 16973 = JCM 13450]
MAACRKVMKVIRICFVDSKIVDLSMYKRHLCHVQTASVHGTNADLSIVTLQP